MRIRITAGGIYDGNGVEVPIGTEIDVNNEPTDWVGRYTVLSEDDDADLVVNPAEQPLDLEGLTVAELKALATEHEIDLGDATLKADIIAAIELAAEKA